MSPRSHLKNQIIFAWQQVIEGDYRNQRVNSERSLQASFWSHLNQALPTNRRLFIEPVMRFEHGSVTKTVIPDIVVCNTREVISIIELKYLPRARPRFEKDIKNLALIAKNRYGISIANERFRGKEKDGKTYALSRNILFTWAGVHAVNGVMDERLFSSNFPSLDGCYLELHAITGHDSDPEILVKP